MRDKAFKLLIEARIQDLHALQGEAAAGCEVVGLDQARVGRLSRMDAMLSQAMNQAAQQRRGLEIRRLKSALEKLQRSGEQAYGFCELCDERIGEARLRLDPAAQYCIECAQDHERR